MFKFLLPLIAALRVPLSPYRNGWESGQDVARAYNGCKLEIRDHGKLQKTIAVREKSGVNQQTNKTCIRSD